MSLVESNSITPGLTLSHQDSRLSGVERRQSLRLITETPKDERKRIPDIGGVELTFLTECHTGLTAAFQRGRMPFVLEGRFALDANKGGITNAAHHSARRVQSEAQQVLQTTASIGRNNLREP